MGKITLAKLPISANKSLYAVVVELPSKFIITVYIAEFLEFEIGLNCKYLANLPKPAPKPTFFYPEQRLGSAQLAKNNSQPEYSSMSGSVEKQNQVRVVQLF